MKQSGSGIPNAWSVIFTFSSITTFYLTITENETKTEIKKTMASIKATIFGKNFWHQKNWGGPHTKTNFVKLHVVVLPHQISSTSIILTRFFLPFIFYLSLLSFVNFLSVMVCLTHNLKCETLFQRLLQCLHKYYLFYVYNEMSVSISHNFAFPTYFGFT